MTDSTLDKTKEKILQGALQVFSQKGYAGATTLDIAAAAGVNEVTIFRRFGRKQKLLTAVIERHSAVSEMQNTLVDNLSGDYRQDLLQIGATFLAMMNQQRGAILMILCEARHSAEVREIVMQTPRHQQKMLGEYLRSQIRRGVVRNLSDPDLAAGAFFAMFFEYSISHMLSPEGRQPEGQHMGSHDEQVVAQFVDIFVGGTIQPSQHLTT